MPAPTLTEQLVRHLARPVGPADVERAALQLLDWLGCAAIGRRSGAGAALSRWAATAGPGPCTVLGSAPSGALEAALVNGGLGNVFELDDVHREALLHPGDVVIPAALALAEREGAPPTALLQALVRGYEAAIEIGRLAGAAHYRHWYGTATCGVFGAAAACADLLGLGAAQAVDALAQAGMQSAGPWQCREEPGFSKQLAAGRAAQSGLLAADLARAGLVGPRRILEGDHGWLVATGAGLAGVPAAAERWGRVDMPWQIHAVSHKPWPACRHVHAAIGCALALREEGLAEADVETLELRTYGVALAFADRPEPRTPHEARFSLQHAVAVALARGTLTLADSQPEALDDATLAAWRRKVRVIADPRFDAAYPGRFAAAATLRRRHAQGESTAVVESVLGDPENPLAPQAVHAKALGLLRTAGIAPAAAHDLATQTLALPHQRSLQAWMQALRATDGTLAASPQDGPWWQ